MTARAKQSTTRTLSRAKAEFRAMQAEAAANPDRLCEFPGCHVNISHRDRTARFCLAHVRRRYEAIVREWRSSGRHRSAHRGTAA